MEEAHPPRLPLSALPDLRLILRERTKADTGAPLINALRVADGMDTEAVTLI
jgi:hypothetical protein